MLTVGVCVGGAALSLFICLQKKIVFASNLMFAFFLWLYCYCTDEASSKGAPNWNIASATDKEIWEWWKNVEWRGKHEKKEKTKWKEK